MQIATEAKLLIVDHEAKSLLILEKLLHSLPVKIYTTHTGNQALALALEHDFALILLNVHLPDIDGYQVLDMLSWDVRTKYTPVILMTPSYADERHKLKGYQYGAVDYIHKPINEFIFLSKVKVFLELYEQRMRYQQLHKRFELILSAAGEGIIELDMNDNISYANPAALHLLGRSESNIIGMPFIKLFAENKIEQDELDCIKNLSLFYKNGFYHKDDSTFICSDKSLLPVEYSISAIKNQNQMMVGNVVVFNDITLRKSIEEQLTNFALYDHLTQLPNRLLFERTIHQAIARASRYQKMMALLFLDLDHFKHVNDHMGHDIGDLLLKEVAKRLSHCVRETDTVARLGGDEFAIILDQIHTVQEAIVIAEKIIHDLIYPFQINHHEILISASIGIATYPDMGKDQVELTKHADIAMYQAKAAGRNHYQLFTETMSSQVSRHLSLMKHLRYAINRSELRLCYQPKLCLVDQKLAGFEVLIRWRHPKLGDLPPHEFIAIAEDMGYIHELGAWVIQTACRTVKKWENILGFVPPVAVNIASAQLLNLNLIEIISTTLRQTNLAADRLQLEITETSFMSNISATADMLTALHQLGIQIAIDDFGTGYSSLSYLKKLTVDYLKIDQTFVHDVAFDVSDAAIVRAVIVLAHTLGIKVIAEGVETQAQLDFLKLHHCDQIQGYWFSPPLAEEAVIDFIRQHP